MHCVITANANDPNSFRTVLIIIFAVFILPSCYIFIENLLPKIRSNKNICYHMMRMIHPIVACFRKILEMSIKVQSKNALNNELSKNACIFD